MVGAAVVGPIDGDAVVGADTGAVGGGAVVGDGAAVLGAAVGAAVGRGVGGLVHEDVGHGVVDDAATGLSVIHCCITPEAHPGIRLAAHRQTSLVSAVVASAYAASRYVWISVLIPVVVAGSHGARTGSLIVQFATSQYVPDLHHTTSALDVHCCVGWADPSVLHRVIPGPAVCAPGAVPGSGSYVAPLHANVGAPDTLADSAAANAVHVHTSTYRDNRYVAAEPPDVTVHVTDSRRSVAGTDPVHPLLDQITVPHPSPETTPGVGMWEGGGDGAAVGLAVGASECLSTCRASTHAGPPVWSAHHASHVAEVDHAYSVSPLHLH